MISASGLELAFLQAFPHALRAARARYASAIALYGNGVLDLEDIQQEAVIAVWLALKRFDSDKASLRTFVERVVTSTVQSQLRRSRAAKRTKRDLPARATGSLELLVRIDFQLDLRSVLRGLTTQDRQVAYLVCEYRAAEVARILNVSRASVHRSIHRIRTTLQEVGFK
jgi:RNA polymerase sigma factor (sigma-70 family)